VTVRWPTLRPWLLRLGVLAAALGLWQGLSAAGVIRADEFPSMTQTASALWDQASTATLWTAIGQTLEGWAIGLAIGTAAALAIGTLIALNQFAYRSVIGVIEFFKAIPVIAILPIGLVLWGATLTMKFALVAFAVFWPLVIQVCYGVRSVDPVVRDTATVLRLRGPRRFATVIVPSAAPYVATGLRVAAAVALVVAIITELIGGGTGIGERILLAENAGPAAYPVMYAYIVVAGLLGVLLAGAFTVAERYALHWHESQRVAVDLYPERTLVTAVAVLSPAGPLPQANGAGADPGLAVRRLVPRLVAMVDGVEVALLPAAVVDPQGCVGPVGDRARPRRAFLEPRAPPRRVRDRRGGGHRARRGAVVAAVRQGGDGAVPVLPVRAARAGARAGRADPVRHRVHDEGGAHRVRRPVADAA
jgi:ABC-type nitrate/sulfonate/bicarbonate transport system permease component